MDWNIIDQTEWPYNPIWHYQIQTITGEVVIECLGLYWQLVLSIEQYDLLYRIWSRIQSDYDMAWTITHNILSRCFWVYEG